MLPKQCQLIVLLLNCACLGGGGQALQVFYDRTAFPLPCIFSTVEGSLIWPYNYSAAQNLLYNIHMLSQALVRLGDAVCAGCLEAGVFGKVRQ